jgi:hypothetical protein
VNPVIEPIYERLVIETDSGRNGVHMDYSMDTAPLAVSQPVTLELIDPSGVTTPISGELLYDPCDPFAVTMVFMAPQSEVRWTFGRELLCEGIYEPSGDGDVHVWPCLDADGHAVVIIELCSPDGEALVQARTGELSSFAERISTMIPFGTESAHLNLDSTIASLLDAPAA